MTRSDRPVFVFDGECVLCSSGVRWLMRHDRQRRLTFASSASPTGAALFAQFGLDPNETYLLIENGRAYTKSNGYLRLCTILGGGWRLLLIACIIPRRFRDWAYDRVARNRYRWFGRVGQCELLTPDERAQLIS